MKRNILLILAVAASACTGQIVEPVEFAVDAIELEESIGPDGGERILTVSAAGEWVVKTDATWIRVAPSYGKGSARCTVSIDSTILANENREALVQIVSDDQSKPKEFYVVQEGYNQFIEVVDTDIKVPNFGEYGKRNLDVRIRTNVPFDVNIPFGAEDGQHWLSYEEGDKDMSDIFDRGARPREFTLRFNYENNIKPEDRVVEVELAPQDENIEVTKFLVSQTAADPIPENCPKGDSLAVVALFRNLNSDNKPNFAEKMSNWAFATLWEASDPEVKENPDLLGRIRSVQVKFVYSEDIIPYEVRYLTAAEEISIYSNANKSSKSLATGPYICELTQLKSLQIFSYGLVELDENFKNLVSLETLDLSGNNFDKIPDVLLLQENFPNLKYLNLAINRRPNALGNMDETYVDPELWGGLYKSGNQDIIRLLKRENLEALKLSNNFINGRNLLPNDYTRDFPKWQDGDQYRYKWNSKLADPETGKKGVWEMHDIPAKLVGTPKILPNATMFAINLNCFSGVLPKWILNHPMLLRWAPESLVFPQERYNDVQGNPGGFTNIPENPDYYYEIYPEQKPEEVE